MHSCYTHLHCPNGRCSNSAVLALTLSDVQMQTVMIMTRAATCIDMYQLLTAGILQVSYTQACNQNCGNMLQRGLLPDYKSARLGFGRELDGQLLVVPCC